MVNKKLFIPLRALAHFLFPHLFLQRNVLFFCVSVQDSPMMRHNNNDGVKIVSFTGLFSAAWSMTLICRCPGFHHFLIDDLQIQWLPSSHPQLTFLYLSSVPFPFNPSISFFSVHLFCAPLHFLLPSWLSSISLYTLSVPPSQWLCGFLHLRYVMALRGRGHFNQYFKRPGPRRTRSKCHVTTWEDDIWRREGRERQEPWNT